MVNSGIAKAEYYYLTGNTRLAIDKLIHTQRTDTLDYYQREIITSRVSELEYELELERDLQI